eukprot:SAG11_NODE_8172_length_1052_cov_1.072403_2_plen_145_part_00
MHIDGKIGKLFWIRLHVGYGCSIEANVSAGMLEENNHMQQHMSRLLFSVVTGALGDIQNAGAAEHRTTAYPIWQPRVGFSNNHEFHSYMHSLYPDRGLENSGLPRPHYEIPEELIWRARTGEVLWHNSHADDSGPQPIHAEPNP